MGKSFFDVFPALKLDDNIREIMEQTTVEKVSTTRKQDFIRIDLSSSKLIDKADILKTEAGIKKQFFAGQDLTVKIYEKFSLSAQYTPSNLISIFNFVIGVCTSTFKSVFFKIYPPTSRLKSIELTG